MDDAITMIAEDDRNREPFLFDDANSLSDPNDSRGATGSASTFHSNDEDQDDTDNTSPDNEESEPAHLHAPDTINTAVCDDADVEGQIRQRQSEDRDEIEHARTMEEYAEQQHGNKEGNMVVSETPDQQTLHQWNQMTVYDSLSGGKISFCKIGQ